MSASSTSTPRSSNSGAIVLGALLLVAFCAFGGKSRRNQDTAAKANPLAK